ncbi:hypothetical protein F4604DRAFT_1953301 [Suillus subluteus]|nr:hypothetical protein F4604DRAFT_1953301 [Suillus subluteus]
MQEACDNVPHIARKVEIMVNHLLCCQYVPGNVKTNAETFKRGKKRQVDDDDKGPSTKPQLASAISNVTPIQELKNSLKDENGSCDPLRIWGLLDFKNPLVQLAQLVLSFVPNSASVERLFSSMGNTKSKRRTRLGVQNNRNMSFLKMELRRQHAIDGTAQRRLKRQFGNPEIVADRDLTGSHMEDQELVMNADTDTLLTDESEPDDNTENVPESNSTPSSSFLAVALQLQQDADDDDNEDSGIHIGVRTSS